MRISAKKYSQSLLDAIQGKSKEEAKEMLARLIVIMAENGDMKKADALIARFERDRDKLAGLRSIEVISAKPLDKATVSEVEDYAKRLFAAKEISMKETVDPGILGGIIIKEGDRVYNSSVRSRMDGIRSAITGN